MRWASRGGEVVPGKGGRRGIGKREGVMCCGSGGDGGRGGHRGRGSGGGSGGGGRGGRGDGRGGGRGGGGD